jgi:hypothetical protein
MSFGLPCVAKVRVVVLTHENRLQLTQC